MKQKILFISDHGDPLIPLGSKQAGGQNNYVKHLALQLDELGYSVDIVTHWSNEQKPAVEQLGERSKVYRFAGGQKGFVDKQQMFAILPSIYEEMKETLDLSSYDVVHTHYWLSGVLAYYLQKEYSFYWCHTNHSLAIAKEQGTGFIDQKRKHFEKIIMQKADVVLATTPNEKKQIEVFTKHVSEVSVVPVGVSPVYLAASEDTKQFTFPYYFYAGRLETSKGIFDLLNAFRHMLKKNDVPDNVKLLIAGGCPESVDLKNFSPKSEKLKEAIKGMEDRVLFLGPKTEKQLKSLYAGALVTIMPSHYESFGMVAAEAQACGCPVIATHVGGLKDVVKSGVTGFHIPKANMQKLSESMVYFLKNSQQILKMRRDAKEYAKREFNWTLISRKVKELYERKNAYVSLP
ncbi:MULTISPECIES: glycosyltransferase [unclassified Solibacillus]|uniref:glycosyltransferase n=1 Tax=unclassified Solibacillus TaxID=2637870 RepID=UPI0030F9C60E